METNQPVQPDIFQANCLSRQVFTLIADHWTCLVIYALKQDTQRFSHLLKRIDGISRKMLTQTLRAMERNGLVQRVVHPSVPPVVEYSLTPLGQTLSVPIEALCGWAYEHLPAVDQARTAYDQGQHVKIQDETAALVQQRQR